MKAHYKPLQAGIESVHLTPIMTSCGAWFRDSLVCDPRSSSETGEPLMLGTASDSRSVAGRLSEEAGINSLTNEIRDSE